MASLGVGSLNAQQIATVAAYWAQQVFTVPNVTAVYSLDQIEAAATSVDEAFNTTLTNAVALTSGNDTIIQALALAVPSPLNGATMQQQTLLACFVLMMRAGILP